MKKAISLTLVFSMVSAQSAWAKAPTWANDCKKAGETAKTACEGKSNAAKAADNSQAAGAQAAVGSGGVMNKGADALKKQSEDQTNRLNTAKTQCEAEKDKCSSECDKEEQDRKAKAGGNPQDPNTQAAKSQEGQVESNKQLACLLPILAIMGGLGAAAAAAMAAGKGSGKTGDASLGTSQPPATAKTDDKPKEPEVVRDANGNATLNCSVEGTSKYSDCNSHYVDKCKANMQDTGCEAFTNRYCGSYAAPAPPADDSLKVLPQNLVVDKQNEGLGTDFCKKAVATKFCAAAGRTQCPTCDPLWPKSPTEAQTAQARAACPSDPMYANPLLPASLTASAYAQGNGANSAGTVSVQSVNGQITSQSLAQAHRVRAGAILAEEEEKQAKEEFLAVGGRATAASLPKDVASQYSPNIFSIQSATYQNLCATDRMLNCGR